jgi:hypothetical protein
MIRRPLILALAFAAASATACGPKKQPRPPVETTPTADPDPPKPPPPKCEKLDEKCEGVGGKKATIPNISLVFEPVVGWNYAQGEKSTVAQTGTETACYALAGHEAPDAKETKKLEAARQAELEVLAGELGVTFGKAKVNWKSPVDKMEVGALKLEIWELKEVTRGAKKGDLVVVASAPADGKALLGVGFVPKDDDQSGGKIMTSIQTLAPGEAPK